MLCLCDIKFSWKQKHFYYSKNLIRLVLFKYYSCPTSFGQKYDHFNLLCKQLDIYVRKVNIVRKVTSALTFLA